METFDAGDDLVVEVHLSGNKPLVRVRSRSMEDDAEAQGVIVWPSELRGLVTALCSAAGVLAEHAAGSGSVAESTL